MIIWLFPCLALMALAIIPKQNRIEFEMFCTRYII